MGFLSRLHDELRRARYSRRGATHKPEDVPMYQYKHYPRMPQVALPEPEDPGTSLASALSSRRSAETGNSNTPLSLKDCGTLFGFALRGDAKTGLRRYPSGGALYPIETYLVSSALEFDSPSVFHYNPTKHALERLWDIPEGTDIKRLVPYPESQRFSSVILFTSVWERSSAKYGDLAFLHALLEAGHMSQNILLSATALGLDARPHAGFEDALASELLDLDEGREQIVHSITVSKA